MSRNHIKRPVTLTPKQAEKIYHAGMAIAELADRIDDGENVPACTLALIGDQFNDVFEENEQFKFEE